jgi:hypothetical protein
VNLYYDDEGCIAVNRYANSVLLEVFWLLDPVCSISQAMSWNEAIDIGRKDGSPQSTWREADKGSKAQSNLYLTNW